MAVNPSYESLALRVQTLEMEIAERDQEMEAVRKVSAEAVDRAESRIAKLIAVNRQLKLEIEEHAGTERELKDSRRLLQLLVDAIEGEVFIKDRDGTYPPTCWPGRMIVSMRRT